MLPTLHHKVLPLPQLPIEAVMPDLLAGVETHTQLILKAAPGAGKSTFFPLQLVKTKAVQGKIIMLEPRRLAARNIATYLARQLGEKVGESIGFRVRGESKTSSATRLEIVTEGIMTRMIQTDPELTGVDMVIFDELHERSIHADTALAFSLEQSCTIAINENFHATTLNNLILFRARLFEFHSVLKPGATAPIDPDTQTKNIFICLIYKPGNSTHCALC